MKRTKRVHSRVFLNYEGELKKDTPLYYFIEGKSSTTHISVRPFIPVSRLHDALWYTGNYFVGLSEFDYSACKGGQIVQIYVLIPSGIEINV